MRIAAAHWHGRISPVFDVAGAIWVADIVRGQVAHRETASLVSRDPFGRAAEVARLGVQVLLCGALSDVLERALVATGVRVISFVCGDLDAVIAAFLRGELVEAAFQMPGGYGRGRRHRVRAGRRWQ